MKKYGLVLIAIIFLASLVLTNVKKSAVTAAFPQDGAYKTLIIDAGHGGEDGGAVAGDGTKESEVNLAVAKKLEAVCGLFGIKTVMTRTSETIAYPENAKSIREMKAADQKARINLVNSYSDAVMISIHQNTYPSPSPHGAEVLYGKTEGSAELAARIQDNLTNYIDPQNRRTSAQISDSIYLMRSVKCTAVLVECGFLSNPGELALLKDDIYKEKLAVIIAASYIQNNTEASYGEG